MPKKLDISWLQELAAERGGVCLSTEYVNSQTKYKWQCKEGHQWEALPVRYSWCPECSGVARKTIQQLQKHAHLRGGVCLSSEYTNNRTKYKWQCKEEHRWEASSHSVMDANSWCPVCSGNIVKNVKYCQELATERGGICLSTEYNNSSTKVLWQCKEGHQWEAATNSVRQGSWCPTCHRINYVSPSRQSIQDTRNIAAKYKGTCLSTDYIDNKTKMKWKCQDGHTFSMRFNSVTTGQWCPECSGHSRKNLEWLHKLAVKRNGLCLSTEYVNSQTKYKWQCKEGHTWEALPVRYSWCPECSGLTKKDTQWLQEVANQKQGQCLSAEYLNIDTKYKWQCKEGHTWEARASDVVHKDSWCPCCHSTVSKGHQEMLDFIKRTTPSLEVKTNDRQQIKPLELDVWIPSKKLAIEFCGMYWHGEKHGKDKAKNKHHYKYLQCAQKSIRLLTIFEYDWIHKKDIVEAMISNTLGVWTRTKVSARKCSVVPIDVSIAKKFLNRNHILGHTTGKCIGLEFNGELVALLVYKIENDKINITRYCTDIQHSVRGGFGKLLKQLISFKKDIYTFSDNRFSEGKLYRQLGFTRDSDIPPSYWYFKGNSQLIHKFNFRKARIRKAFPGITFEPTDTELQMTQKLDYDRIWDCGKAKWVLPR